MDLISFTWYFIQLLIGYNLVFSIVIYFIWSAFGKNQQSIIDNSNISTEADYAIIVTAYKETNNLFAVVNSILNLNFKNYIVYIVADNCNDVSHLVFNSDKIIVLKPEEVIASNTGSHQYAIDHFIRNHDRITILDSDNLVHPEYLNEISKFFDSGYHAVQGSREAKNLDTTLSCLDAARDFYYHFYDGMLLFQIGSSATLAGSGMAFSTFLYKDFLRTYQVKGAGFDKLLQYFILKKNYVIAFNKNAIVYDEKTSKSEQLVQQRARWINTWFKYFRLGFSLFIKGVIGLNLNQFIFGLVLLRPPLFIFLIISAIFMLISIFINPMIALLWLLGFVLFTVGFFIALKHWKADKKIYSSLKNIPNFMFLQVISLLKSYKANKYSVSTQHFHTNQIESVKKEI